MSRCKLRGLDSSYENIYSFIPAMNGHMHCTIYFDKWCQRFCCILKLIVITMGVPQYIYIYRFQALIIGTIWLFCYSCAWFLQCMESVFAGFLICRNRRLLAIWEPFYQHGLILIPAWTNNHMPIIVRGEIAYPFTSFNLYRLIWDPASNFISHFTGHVIICPCWD